MGYTEDREGSLGTRSALERGPVQKLHRQELAWGLAYQINQTRRHNVCARSERMQRTLCYVYASTLGTRANHTAGVAQLIRKQTFLHNDVIHRTKAFIEVRRRVYCAMANADAKIPVSVVTGFLGAGGIRP